MKTGKLKAVVASLVAIAASFSVLGEVFSYRIEGDTSITITRCPTGTKGAVAIPASIDGHKVSAIDDDAFNGCKKVTSVSVPATVTYIGERCFRKCSKLKTLTFAAGGTGLFIDANAFEGAALKTLVLPEKTELDDDVFFDSKITSLEVQDANPNTYLSNLDDALSPYTGSGKKLKLRSEIKKLTVPRGRKNVYEAELYQFLLGRKPKNRGTVVAQYPRVWVDTTQPHTGGSYFKVNGKKVSSGTPVKPGTKDVQFVSVAAAGYAPENVYRKAAGEGYWAVSQKANSCKFTMPNDDMLAYGSFVEVALERKKIDAVADAINATGTQYRSVGESTHIEFQQTDQLVTKTTFTFAGLPSGLAGAWQLGRQTTDYGNLFEVNGAPKTRVDVVNSPIFVTIKGASGYSRVACVRLSVTDGTADVANFTASSTGTQTYNVTTRTLSVLAGLNYPNDAASVSYDVPSGWSISAVKKTLPAGVKLVKTGKTTYVLSGRPTKPGTYVVEVVFTKGKTKQYARLAYQVYAHPLKGNYRGYVNTPGVGCGPVTMAVDAAGKATVSFTEKSTKTTVKNVYPALKAGTLWDSSSPLVGQFTYAFKVPKRGKIPARTLKLAYATDTSSGVSGVAHVRSGPEDSFSLTSSSGKGDAERVRCFPQVTAAAAKASTFYSSSDKRDYGSFSILLNGGVSDYTTGEAIWATAFYDWSKASVTVKGRLPAGKAFSVSVPMVSAYRLNSSWSKFTEMNYHAIAAAPFFVSDADGRPYLLKLPTDPSVVTASPAGCDPNGFFRLDAALGSITAISGSVNFNKEKFKTSPKYDLKNYTPTLRMAFDGGYWSTSDAFSTVLDTNFLTITIDGVANDYTFDPATGLWKFSFVSGGVTYTFEGVPRSSYDFCGMVGATVNKKTYSWGAARIFCEF